MTITRARVRGLLVAAALLTVAAGVVAASAIFEVVTISTSPTRMAAATRDGAKACYLTVETQPIRWRYDGANPTSTVGHPAAAGAQITLTSRTEIEGFLAIRDTTASGDATMEVTCER